MPSWFTSKLVWWLVLTLAVIPPVTGVVLTIADQWIRNVVVERMSGPDIFDSVSITSEEYHALPFRWQQNT